jgi:mitofilin
MVEQRGATTIQKTHSPPPAVNTTIPPKTVAVVPPAPPTTTVTATTPPPPRNNKKKRSFTGILIRTLLLGSAIYGATLYAATKNDKVYDFVSDNQLPYHEELMDLIDNGSLDDLKSGWDNLVLSLQHFELPSKEKLEELTTNLESKSEKIIEEAKKKLSSTKDIPDRVSPTVEEAIPAVGDSTPAQQLQKPVETVQREVKQLPLILLKSKASDLVVDPTVKATIDSFNDLIRAIDHTPRNEALCKSVNENISKLSAKLNLLTAKFEDELQSKLKVTQNELLLSYTKKELDLTENFLQQFNLEKIQLERKLKQRLVGEIEATKEAIGQAAVNAVTLMRIEQTKNFETLIKTQIDNERNGRLQNLAHVNQRLEKLESFALELETQLVANHHKTLVQQLLSKLKGLIFNAPATNERAQLLAPFVDNLQKAAKETNDELLQLAVADLASVTAKESTHSILTNSQLLSRWEQLSPELRSALLLPPNAGLLGHLSSILFSKLLLPTKGARPDGKDIESVIGRVEQLLTRGELDVAIEEAANLKGWTRKLADDWVIEGRKRLETEFLLSLIDSESRIL